MPHAHLETATQSALLAAERAHSFYQNPEAWLTEAAKGFRSAFDTSGTPVTEIMEFCVDEGIKIESTPGYRIVRTPGSGILQSTEQYVARVKAHLAAASPDAEYTANCHEGCGACMVYCKSHHESGNPDEVGKCTLEDRQKELKHQGVHVHSGYQVPLVELKRPANRHPALMTTVDCTGGRLQDITASGLPASFVVSTLDADEAAQALALTISIASGPHGYGDALDAYTVLLVRDPQNPTFTAQVEQGLEQIKADAKIPLHIITVNAPV